jgi:hypothetical protein
MDASAFRICRSVQWGLYAYCVNKTARFYETCRRPSLAPHPKALGEKPSSLEAKPGVFSPHGTDEKDTLSTSTARSGDIGAARAAPPAARYR